MSYRSVVNGLVDVRFGSLADLFSNSSLMSAFPNSGRSDHPKTAKIKVRFRPIAVILNQSSSLAVR
jgi:hypothetical protein